MTTTVLPRRFWTRRQQPYPCLREALGLPKTISTEQPPAPNSGNLTQPKRFRMQRLAEAVVMLVGGVILLGGA
jgi:hypothetical protein